jgi:hypothetical protein
MPSNKTSRLSKETYVHGIVHGTRRQGRGGGALIGESEIKEFNKIKRALPGELRESSLPISA